jgi:dihydroorotase
MTLVIKNGRILDPASGRDEVADLLIEDGKVAKIGKALSGDESIDATGKLVTPGLIDMHVHLREPGREDKETIGSGSDAAAAGGFTSICPMPNTDPVCDSAQGLQFLASRARETAKVNIFPVGALTKGQKGEAIVEFGDMVYYGAVAFSDDGHPVMNTEIMRRGLEYTSMFNVPVLDHCEDLNLSENGQMRAGAMASKLGLKGVPAAANSSQVARDIDLADYTDGHVHIQHASVKATVEYVRMAKQRGVNVTCEATPHHLTLTDECLATYNPNFKMSPPLGNEDDRQALIAGLRDGSIEAVATDHAPHTDMEKDSVFADAPNGVLGMETAFPVLYTKLVETGEIDLQTLIERMTAGPARILHLEKGSLAEGVDADVAIFDLNDEYTVEAQKFFSRSHNCPFDGWKLKGRTVATIVGGKVVFKDGKLL